tara:strand:+ start:2342 stop:5338 length:2997 start_codon:yes stop_codon:yes gene_type:complete
MALPQNRQERNIISTTVSETLPDFVRQDHPTFVKFVETYYEFLESKENSFFAPLSLNGVVDIDKTSDEFVKYFKTHTMSKFPENFKSVKGDELDIKKILKRIRSFYLAKGTESSIEFLIRLLFDVYVETYRPAEDIFKTSGGFWYAPTVVRCTDSNPIENAKIRGQRVEFLESGKSIGTAVVDEIHQFVMSGQSVLELELVEISNLTLTDKSIIKLPNGSESLFSMVIDVPITNPTGSFYTVDDPVTITGVGGSQFKGSVEAVNKSGAIRKVRIDQPGINYLSSGQHTASVTTDTGTGASLPDITYGYIFTKPGVFLNNDGKLSSTEFLQDSFRYQMHSYVIRTEASLSEYKDVLKDLVHPAGKKVLGDYFVYRTGFGPSADFVGFRSEELASPFFANYLPYTIATVSDGAFNASNNGQFGVLDSSIDLRGVCSGFIGSGSYPDLYYDYFPYGYDGATGYTLEFPSNQEDNLTPRTSFGTGLSLGSDNQDLNKFGGIGATQEFFARLGKWPRKVQEVQYFNRLSAQNRDQHELAPFERGDIVTQLDENGNNRLFGVVYENSWSQNFGRFKVLISNTSNRNFRAASPSEQEIAFQTSSSLHKVQNVTKGSVYTGGSDFKQELKFFGDVGAIENFFKVGDHIYQGTGGITQAQGLVTGKSFDSTSNELSLSVKILTDNDNIDLYGTSFTAGISSDCVGGRVYRVKGSGHDDGQSLSSTTGSTSGGDTYSTSTESFLTTITFFDGQGSTHDENFFKTGDHIYQGTAGTTQAQGFVVAWVPPVLSVLDITSTDNFLNGSSLSHMPDLADTSECFNRIFRVKGSGHGAPVLSQFIGSTNGGEVYTGGTGPDSFTISTCTSLSATEAVTPNFFVETFNKGPVLTQSCDSYTPFGSFLETTGEILEDQFGGVVESVTTLIEVGSYTGATLPGWPSGGTDFWIVHPHPNTWHGNITAGISWGDIPLQSFIRTPFKLTSPPEYGASGSVNGSINQINNTDIPGGYGS